MSKPSSTMFRGHSLLANPLANLVCGVLLVMASILVANALRLAPNAIMDWQGLRTEGSAERMEDGSYALRYTHPGGAIYRLRYHGSLGFQGSPNQMSTITIVYLPQRPAEFQPAGISYVPTAVVLPIALAGFMLVLRARYLTREFNRSERHPL